MTRRRAPEVRRAASHITLNAPKSSFARALALALTEHDSVCPLPILSQDAKFIFEPYVRRAPGLRLVLQRLPPSPPSMPLRRLRRPERRRVTMWRQQPMLTWPATRLVGRHRVGWHGSGSGVHKCDFPGCRTIRSWVQQSGGAQGGARGARGGRGRGRGRGRDGAAALSTPLPAGLTLRPMVTGTGRDPSPAPSDASDMSQGGAGKTKMYCMDCYDPSNRRPMNFHARCWNEWHGLCLPASDA